MNTSYHIRLPQREWDTLMISLTRYNHDRQERINNLFSSIERDISVRHENGRAIIESARLNEAAIRAALGIDSSEKLIEKNETQSSYDITAIDTFNAEGPYATPTVFAEQDEYPKLLTVSQEKSLIYASTNVVGMVVAAA